MKKALLTLSLVLLLMLASCENATVAPTSSSPSATETTAIFTGDPLWNDPALTQRTFEKITLRDYKELIIINLTKSGEIELGVILSDFEQVTLPADPDRDPPLDCQKRVVSFFRGSYLYENEQYFCSFETDLFMRWEFVGKDAESFKTDYLSYVKEHENENYDQYDKLINSCYLYNENKGNIFFTIKPKGDSLAIIRQDNYDNGFKTFSYEYDEEGMLLSETAYGKNDDNKIEYTEYYTKEVIDTDNYTIITTRKDSNGNVVFTIEEVYAPGRQTTTINYLNKSENSKRDIVTKENGVEITTYYFKNSDYVTESTTLVYQNTRYYRLEKTTVHDNVVSYYYSHNESEVLGGATTKSTDIVFNDMTDGLYNITVTTYNRDPDSDLPETVTESHKIPGTEFDPSDWETDYLE